MGISSTRIGRGAACLAASLILLAACVSRKPGRAGSITAPHTADAPPHAADAPPSAQSDPVLAGSPPPVELKPADLPSEIAAQVSFLSDLCAVAVHTDAEAPHGLRAGCRNCPPFEDSTAFPRGGLALDPEEFFELDLIVPGHFTDAGADQRLAVFEGCEPHSSNWGGTVLAERQGDHFRSRDYFSGIHPHACKTYRRSDGRDIAVCAYADAHQSIATEWLTVIDFSQTPPDDRTLLTLTSQDLCLSGPGVQTSTDEQIEDYTFESGKTKAERTLLVRIARTTHTLNAPYRRYCQKRTETEARVEPPPAKRALTTLRFRYDGRQFVPR